MAIRTAQRLCPDLIVLPPNPRLYARASRALHEILRIYASTIEPRGYGHAFLDLTGTRRLFGPPQDVAVRIQRETSERLSLSVSVGVATNKLVSQAAIRADRRTGGWMDGRTAMQRSEESLYVPAGDERDFLAPHPLAVMPELDSGIRTRLEDYQLDLIGEVAAIPESALCAVFGHQGRTLRARAQGIDPRPVLPPERQAEFHVSHTLSTDTNDIGILFPLLRLMSEPLGRRLRQRGLTAGRLHVEMIYADYTAGARAVPLRAAVLDAELWDAARRAFVLANTKRLAVRTVALTLGRLMETEAQLELWAGRADGWTDGQVDGRMGRRTESLPEHSTAKAMLSAACLTDRLSACPPVHPSTRLQHALDHIRTRYGSRAVRGGPLTSHLSPLTSHHSTTILPKVALPSMTR
jgi:DNA polymerase-4